MNVMHGNKVMIGVALVWASIGVLAAAGPEGAATPRAAKRTAQVTAPTAPAKAPAEYQELVTKYCVTCHNERLKIPTADPLNLQAANLDNPGADAAVWEKVVHKLAVGSMPPQGLPTPGETKLVALRTWLAASLDRAAADQTRPGEYILHRLNRAEYANAIRDLLGVELDVTDLLPSDGADFGFDNVATGLRTSPLLLNRYLTAALRISNIAVGNPTVAPDAHERTLTLEVTQRDHVPGLPLGTRGGTVVHHNFPADGEYEFSARLARTVLNGYVGVVGHEKPYQYIVTLDGDQIYSAPVGGMDDHKADAEDPQKFGKELNERLRVKIPVKAGPHDVGFTWIDKAEQEQAVWQPPLRDTQEVHMAGGLPRLRTVTIEGPFNATGVSDTPSRDRIFVCHPATAAEEAPCAEKIFLALARRAYRRPVTAADVEAPLAFYKDARQKADFDSGIRAGVARVLASPSFVFRSERDADTLAPGTAHKVTDVELASRLSFFLWSSVPDDELLNLAAAGQLRAPGVFEKQVRRMVADKRADALVSNFVGQWLQLRNLEKRVTPDLLLFPDFDDNVRQGFRKETEMFFASIMRDNASTIDLLSADYTFVDERLAKHYGIPGVYGDRFRRVTLTDPNRRGLLGQGSILALTSVANRTSPTIRGKYVLSVLLNTPPPPPPPSVPPLDKSASATKPQTVREQVEAHRSNPVCASCHKNIDPVGFALENFDSVGQWRDTTKEGLKMDTSGVLIDGSKIDGPIALREALLKRPDVFVGTVTENLMVYALGRGLEPADMPVVRGIIKKASVNNYKFMSIVMGIVESAPFQMRTKPGAPKSDDKLAQVNNKTE